MTNEEFKAIRKDRKLTQEQLADLLGITRVQVNRIENKHRKVSRIVDFAMRHLPKK